MTSHQKPSLLWLAALSSYWFASSFKWFLVLVFLFPERVQQFVPGGEKSAYWGAVFGFGAVWAVIGPALFGDWSDRLGDRRRFLLVGATLTAPAVLLAHSAPSLWLLTVAYLLIQVTDDIATGPYSALVPELVDREDRGRASGVMGAAMALGQLTAVGAALILSAQGIWLYLLLAALNLGSAFLVVRIIPPAAMAGPRLKRLSFMKGWLRPWKSRDFRNAWLSRFFATLGFYFVIPYTQFFLQDAVSSYRLFGMTVNGVQAATGVLALTLAFASGVASFATGPLIDRVGRRPVLTVGGTIAAVALLFLTTTTSYPVLWACALVLGLGYGAFQSAGWAQAADVLPEKEGMGRDMGIWQMSISSVQIVAGAAGTIAMAGNRYVPLLGYRILFVLAAIAIGAGVLVARRVREDFSESK